MEAQDGSGNATAERMLNILIPMAGKGSRFAERGYAFPKPLIEIRKKPMIQVVVENLAPQRKHRFIFICQKQHTEEYAMRELLQNIAPGSEMVIIDGITEGAACTVLTAKEFINNEDELVIANSDQFVDMKLDSLVDDANKRELDGSILTFEASHPKWSYARTGENGLVDLVAEKRPISRDATVGIYYYRKGKDFVDAAERMIMKNIRTNNEFYVCPVYNEMIGEKKKVGVYRIPAEKMWGLGTPEDLEQFLKSEYYAKV